MLNIVSDARRSVCIRAPSFFSSNTECTMKYVNSPRCTSIGRNWKLTKSPIRNGSVPFTFDLSPWRSPSYSIRKKFLLKPYMVLDAVNGQEEQDAHTQSYGNPLEAEIAACLVQFINEQAKVPFSRKWSVVDAHRRGSLLRNRHYHSVRLSSEIDRTTTGKTSSSATEDRHGHRWTDLMPMILFVFESFFFHYFSRCLPRSTEGCDHPLVCSCDIHDRSEHH